MVFLTAKWETSEEAKGLELGAVDYIRKPFSPPIIRARIRNHLELKKNRDLLENLSTLDGLTNIPNRRRFDEIYAHEWTRAIRTKSPLSLLFIDIDHFKNYNESVRPSRRRRLPQGRGQGSSVIPGAPCGFSWPGLEGEEFIILLPGHTRTGLHPPCGKYPADALKTSAHRTSRFSGRGLPHRVHRLSDMYGCCTVRSLQPFGTCGQDALPSQRMKAETASGRKACLTFQALLKPKMMV